MADEYTERMLHEVSQTIEGLQERRIAIELQLDALLPLRESMKQAIAAASEHKSRSSKPAVIPSALVARKAKKDPAAPEPSHPEPPAPSGKR